MLTHSLINWSAGWRDLGPKVYGGETGGGSVQKWPLDPTDDGEFIFQMGSSRVMGVSQNGCFTKENPIVRNG